ncbi:MAG: hypothetical protein P4L22_06715 [Candidatus Babeliales bacterium]|nr:hypothetical protein [Candidatus Babeliales bacterium]
MKKGLIFALLFSLISFIKLGAAEQVTTIAELKAVHSILSAKCNKFPNVPTLKLNKEIQFLLHVYKGFNLGQMPSSEKQNYHTLIAKIITSNNDLVIRHLKVNLGYQSEDVEGVKEEIRKYIRANFPTTSELIIVNAKYLADVVIEQDEQVVAATPSSATVTNPPALSLMQLGNAVASALESTCVILPALSSSTTSSTKPLVPSDMALNGLNPTQLPTADELSPEGLAALNDPRVLNFAANFAAANAASVKKFAAESKTNASKDSALEESNAYSSLNVVPIPDTNYVTIPGVCTVHKSEVIGHYKKLQAESSTNKWLKSGAAGLLAAAAFKFSTTEMAQRDPKLAALARVVSGASVLSSIYNAIRG